MREVLLRIYVQNLFLKCTLVDFMIIYMFTTIAKYIIQTLPLACGQKHVS